MVQLPRQGPMLARLVRELPVGGYLYEPKWDGFRCLVAREGDRIELTSRNGRSLARYFPELVDALQALPIEPFVLDGELVVAVDGALDFEALLARLHPAASRVELLAATTPASLVLFDVLQLGVDDLVGLPFAERRRLLEAVAANAVAPLHLTPLTDDPAVASAWLDRFAGGGIDGVVAKHVELRYLAGKRAMLKVKTERTAECVVAGFRWLAKQPLPSSLLLGLYDATGVLRHIGVAASFTAKLRRELLAQLEPRIVALETHPWQDGFLLEGGATGRLPGAAGRWTPDMPLDWTPVAPDLVCEVAYEQLDERRLRHPARFRRWRPDRDPRSCTIDQLEAPAIDVDELLRAT